MLRKMKILTLTLTSVFVITACGGKGFEASTLGSGDGGNNGAGTGDGGNTTTPDAYSSLMYDAKISGGDNDQTVVVELDKQNQSLLLVLPLAMNPYIDTVEAQFPSSRLPDVKFMTYKNDKGRSFLAVSVPLRYVLKGAGFLTPSKLPNGDALPQVPSGELPSLGITLPGKNNVQFHIYLGVNVVGLYVSSPFNPYIYVKFPIRSGLQTVGYFHAIPAKGSYDGGFFLATSLPKEVAAIIDDHFRF